ncbi:MAG: TatD family hydrolase [Bacillota bacterium]|jgi:TatD DNase family protein
MDGTVLFDTHAHLNDEQFVDDFPEVIKRAQEEGVIHIAVVGSDLFSSLEAVKIAGLYDGIYGVIGVHPHAADTLNEEVLTKLRLMAQESKVVAIGEIGLDYYYNYSPEDIQKKAFREQIILAKELGKPIVIHDREAHGDTMRILKEEKAGANGGILHCFSGSWEMARECLDLGFYISFAGPVTFHNATRLGDIARKVPLDRILVETDCPYLSPHPYRGKRNEPARVRVVAEKIAQLREISLEKFIEMATKNAFQAYRILS